MGTFGAAHSDSEVACWQREVFAFPSVVAVAQRQETRVAEKRPLSPATVAQSSASGKPPQQRRKLPWSSPLVLAPGPPQQPLQQIPQQLRAAPQYLPTITVGDGPSRESEADAQSVTGAQGSSNASKAGSAAGSDEKKLQPPEAYLKLLQDLPAVCNDLGTMWSVRTCLRNYVDATLLYNWKVKGCQIYIQCYPTTLRIPKPLLFTSDVFRNQDVVGYHWNWLELTLRSESLVWPSMRFS